MSTETFSLDGKRIYVAGHLGMVGSALLRRLSIEPCETVTADRSLDLREQQAVEDWFLEHRPDAAIIAAARVGGILANTAHPAQFIYDNLMIAANTIEAARKAGTKKLLFLGSSCIYPRLAAQPISEDSLLTGALEPTNEWYALAKIAGVKLCQAYRREYGCDFISAMPTNLYGPGDNYDRSKGHVIPALLSKAHEAKSTEQDQFVVLGSGTPLREFLHVDDLADACIHLLKSYSAQEPINIGSGEEISIAELAKLIAKIVDFEGEVRFDPSQPDGTPRKLLDSAKIRALGWKPSIGLAEGLAATYRDARQEFDKPA